MPNAIRVKCTECGTTFRSTKLLEWELLPEPRQYEEVFVTIRNEKGEEVLRKERRELPTFRGRHQPKYTMCRPCAQKTKAFTERRPT